MSPRDRLWMNRQNSGPGRYGVFLPCIRRNRPLGNGLSTFGRTTGLLRFGTAERTFLSLPISTNRAGPQGLRPRANDSDKE
jgi:hypothetical protein